MGNGRCTLNFVTVTRAPLTRSASVYTTMSSNQARPQPTSIRSRATGATHARPTDRSLIVAAAALWLPITCRSRAFTSDGLHGQRGLMKLDENEYGTTIANVLTVITATSAASHGHASFAAMKVPDPRVDAFSDLYRPGKITYAEVSFVDLPGAWGKGSGLDADAAKALGDADAFCLVVRAFPGGDGSPPDPLKQLRDFDAELVLADMVVVEKRLDRLRKEHGKGSAEFHELSRLAEHLEAGRPLRTMRWSDAEEKEMAHFHFLSRQPMLVEAHLAEGEGADPPRRDLVEAAKERGAEALALSAAVEAEIAQLDPKDQSEFLESLGLSEPARARFIRAAYRLLDLICFF